MSDPEQPIDEHSHSPHAPKTDGYGPSEADAKPGQEKGKYDKPSTAEGDFAIDEQRERRIRGNESPKDVADPD